MRTGASLQAIGLLLLITAAACDAGPTGPEGSTRVRLRGRVTVAPSAGLRDAATGAPVAVGDVQKVLVYRDIGFADVVPVGTDGRFSIDVARAACGLVFLDAANHVVGYLSLPSGLATLPLMFVDNSVGVVDLADITISDGVGVPGHDPTAPGGEMQMTAEELAAYRQQSALFATIVRNLDMNGDGVLDILSPRPYWIQLRTVFTAQGVSTVDPGPASPIPAVFAFSFFFTDFSVIASPAPATLSLPNGVQHPVHSTFTFADVGPGRPPRYMTMFHWVLDRTGWESFREGIYNVTYQGYPALAFRLFEPLDFTHQIVAHRPWFEVVNDTVTRVHWQWRMRDGRPIDPTRLMRPLTVGIQFIYTLGPAENPVVRLTPDQTSIAVRMPLSGLQQISFGATDLFGNELVTTYALSPP